MTHLITENLQLIPHKQPSYGSLASPKVTFKQAFRTEEYPRAALTRPLRHRMTEIECSNACVLFQVIMKIAAYLWYGPKALWGTWTNYQIMSQTETNCTEVHQKIGEINQAVSDSNSYELRLYFSHHKCVTFGVTSQISPTYSNDILELIRTTAKKGIELSECEVHREGDSDLYRLHMPSMKGF